MQESLSPMKVTELAGNKIAVQCHNKNRYEQVTQILYNNGIDISGISYQHAFETCISVNDQNKAVLHYEPDIERTYTILNANFFIEDNTGKQGRPNIPIITQAQSIEMYNLLLEVSSMTNKQLKLLPDKCKQLIADMNK